MNYDVDITKIALSHTEAKKLRWLSKHEPVHDKGIENNAAAYRLYKRGLIERCYSERFPYEMPSRGIVEIPVNAFRLTDAGQQYLNYCYKQDRDRWVTWILALWGAITGSVSIAVEIWLHFL